MSTGYSVPPSNYDNAYFEVSSVKVFGSGQDTTILQNDGPRQTGATSLLDDRLHRTGSVSSRAIVTVRASTPTCLVHYFLLACFLFLWIFVLQTTIAARVRLLVRHIVRLQGTHLSTMGIQITMWESAICGHHLPEVLPRLLG